MLQKESTYSKNRARKCAWMLGHVVRLAVSYHAVREGTVDAILVRIYLSLKICHNHSSVDAEPQSGCTVYISCAVALPADKEADKTCVWCSLTRHCFGSSNMLPSCRSGLWLRYVIVVCLCLASSRGQRCAWSVCRLPHPGLWRVND